MRVNIVAWEFVSKLPQNNCVHESFKIFCNNVCRLVNFTRTQSFFLIFTTPTVLLNIHKLKCTIINELVDWNAVFVLYLHLKKKLHDVCNCCYSFERDKLLCSSTNQQQKYLFKVRQCSNKVIYYFNLLGVRVQ